jgi:hypothetical protein
MDFFVLIVSTVSGQTSKQADCMNISKKASNQSLVDIRVCHCCSMYVNLEGPVSFFGFIQLFIFVLLHVQYKLNAFSVLEERVIVLAAESRQGINALSNHWLL